MSKPTIYFYVPKEKFRADWPKSLTDNWVAFGGGANVWSYFTPIALREHGYPVEITTEIPQEGIVLSHAQYLPQSRIVNNKTLLICIRADYGRNHPADMHIVQNIGQVSYAGKDFFEYLLMPGPSYFIPYWPQPGLIPRDKSRGTTFENIVYMGARQNLAAELKSNEFQQALNNAGMQFIMNLDRAAWHDYSQVDAILAVRSFSRSKHLRKPPSKLINAWLAEVPAILGPDSAFRALRQTDTDFIEVNDMASTISALIKLRENPSLRNRMIETGIRRGNEYSVQAVAQRWWHFLENAAIPYYDRHVGRSGWNCITRKAARDLRIWIKNV